MGDRLTARDVAFLRDEQPTTPRHNATVSIFEPGPDGFRYDDMLSLVADRLSFVPRFRQKLQPMPGRVANPIWIDDPAFDLEYHVRLSALPRPGDHDQLRDLVGRIAARPLDRARPLWEMYLIEGLEGGRFAVLSKAHQALVDGVETLDLGHVLLDLKADVSLVEEEAPAPRHGRRVSAAGLLVDAARDALTDPNMLLDTARSQRTFISRAGRTVARQASRVAAPLVGGRPDRSTAITGRLSQQRRIVTVEEPLENLRQIRSEHGGSINDVILAVVTGGLRAWLMTRAESFSTLRQIRAIVPVSVIDDNEEVTSLGSQIAVHVVDLPVAEASPIVRLHQVSWSFESHQATGRGVAASRLVGISGFAPSTFHAVGNRAAAALATDAYHLVVTNAPGPQTPRYAAGAKMVATYPVPPLTSDHALAIGVTSYNGTVFFGITTDRDLIPDAEILGQCFRDAIDELVEGSAASRPRAPRGRRAPRGPAE